MSYALALVYAWLIEHPEHYCSYVRPYTRMQWSPVDRNVLACRVGAHWRRLADWAHVLPAMQCTCKFEVLSTPKHLGTPLTAHKRRWEEDGTMIPRKYRVWVFV
jgi:hypothetical protein